MQILDGSTHLILPPSSLVMCIIIVAANSNLFKSKAFLRYIFFPNRKKYDSSIMIDFIVG